MRRSNSSPTAPLGNLPKIRGFCVDVEGEKALLAAGVEVVWRRGNGDESLDWVIASFREEPGTLAITDSLLIFGESKKEILAVLSTLARNKIALVDIRRPDLNVHDLEDEAYRALSASNGMKDKRTARKRGRLGGVAKREAARLRREASDPHGLAKKIWQRADIPLRIRTELLAGICSASTARRIFA